MSIILRRATAILVSIEIWPVAVLAAASVISSKFLPLALIISLIFWPARWIVCQRITVRTPADWGVALLCLIIPITLWVTPVVDKTLLQVLRLACGILLFYAMVNWAVTPARLNWLALAFVIAGLLLGLLAPAVIEWIVKLPIVPLAFFQRFTLLVTDPANPNVYAGTLVILLPLALAGAIFGKKLFPGIMQLTNLGISGVMMVILALTQSRGAWLAFGAAIISLISLRWRRGWLVLPLVGIGLIGILYHFGPGQVVGFIISSATLGGVEGRMEVWARGTFILQDFPFTGIGLGAFPDVARGLFPFAEDLYLKVPHVHNLFLQVAVDLGLPGLIAWLAILGTTTVASWRLFLRGRELQDIKAAGLGAGLLCSQIALVIHGMTDSVTWGMVRPAPLVWALWGLMVAGNRVYEGYSGRQGKQR